MIICARRGDAERALLAAIVELAVQEASGAGSPIYCGTMERRSALLWLFDDSDDPFSFCWICRMFAVNADAAQESLWRAYGKPVRMPRPAALPAA